MGFTTRDHFEAHRCAPRKENPLFEYLHDINRDYWMSAAEAKDYGVIDLIVGQTEATAAADRAEAAVTETTETAVAPATRTGNGRS